MNLNPQENNARAAIAALENIELRRPDNLYELSISDSTKKQDAPVFAYFDVFFQSIKGFYSIFLN